MTAVLLPNGKQQFIDINGKPLVGGTVGMYVPNTLITKITWQDSGQLVLNTNPIILDSRGQALIYGSGVYRQIVRDSHGNLIWDEPVASPGSSGETITFVDTIAALQALGSLSSTIGVVYVRGYRSATGNGGGIFSWNAASTATPNGGTIFAAAGVTTGRWLRKLEDASSITVEMFGSYGDSVTDDILSFQLAANYIYSIGGGQIVCTLPVYTFSKYTTASVSNNIIGKAATPGNYSTTLFLPSNCKLTSTCNSVINLSTFTPVGEPFAFPLQNGILAGPIDLTFSNIITSVDQNNSTITVSDVTGLTVGQVVDIEKQGGGGQTPSGEGAPHQFMTIQNISTGVLTFKEAFLQDFEAAQNLRLVVSREANKAFSQNIYLENIIISANNASFERVWNCGLLGKVSTTETGNIQFGTCQEITIETWEIRNDTSSSSINSLESAVSFQIGHIIARGGSCSNPLGALLIDDNCRAGYIKKAEFYKYTSGGLSLFYGADVEIDELNFSECASTAPIDGYGGCVSAGLPWGGIADPTLPEYLFRNCGISKIRIKRLNCTGTSTVPVRWHDGQAKIDQAYIEYANPGDGAPIMLGYSGLTRADTTYFPQGGILTFEFDYIEVKTLSGTPATILFHEGVQGGFAGYQVTLTAPSVAASANITVDFPDLISVGNPTIWLGGIQRTVLSISGFVVTLSVVVGAIFPSGTGVATEAPQIPITTRIKAGIFVLDGVVTPVISGQAFKYPQFVGAMGTYTLETDVPSDGLWELIICGVSGNLVSFTKQSYIVNTGAGTISATGTLVTSAGLTITSASFAGTTVSILFTSTAADTEAQVSSQWLPYQPVTAF